MVSVFDHTICETGEGPLWHPVRQQFFWVDIPGKKLFTRVGDDLVTREFDEHVSAAGWVDHDTLMVATETGLFKHDIASGDQTLLVEIEADDATTRSNDGRADPWGGFWIGTMGKKGETDAGAIYRYYRGEVRTLYDNLTITNSICFSPDQEFAYYADTRASMIWRQKLSPDDGWPVGDSEDFIDLRAENLNPDGSVVDAEGNLWNAQWGAGRVAKYSPSGQFISAIEIPAAQTTCPAFGGADLSDLFVTSASSGKDGENDGKTFLIKSAGIGQAEHQVII